MRNVHRRLCALPSVTAAAVLLIASAGAGRAAEEEQKDDNYALMRMFVETFEHIDRSYVSDLDRRKLIEAAVRGMIRELDQYSSYIAPDEVDHLNQIVEQEFGGIGIQVHLDITTRRLAVMTPLPGTPAYKAGVRAGDVVMEIEGESTEGITISQAVRLLKGKPGEAVTIGVRHTGETDVEKITIVRELIQVATVLGDRYDADNDWEFMLDDDRRVGYIRLTHFSRRSARELADALHSLTARDLKGLVLDLRYNPGGLLSQATAIADLFVRKGKIVSTKGRNTEKRVWKARSPGTFDDFPMAVIVNHASASASEILSACLQDNQRAVIVGERTWGKGSVQNVINLENGASALKLTTASYLRPSGKNIHRFPDMSEEEEWGVLPSEGFAVELTPQDRVSYLKYRRNRDVIDTDGPPESDFVDRTLQKAVEYVVAQIEILNEPPAKTETDTDAGAQAESSDTAAPKGDSDPDETDESESESGAYAPGTPPAQFPVRTV